MLSRFASNSTTTGVRMFGTCGKRPTRKSHLPVNLAGGSAANSVPANKLTVPRYRPHTSLNTGPTSHVVRAASLAEDVASGTFAGRLAARAGPGASGATPANRFDTLVSVRPKSVSTSG